MENKKLRFFTIFVMMVVCIFLFCSYCYADDIGNELDKNSYLNDIFEEAINYVKENGIMQGYSDGSFGAEKIMTNCEFFVVLLRSFYDGDLKESKDNKWYSDYIETIKNENIFSYAQFYKLSHEDLNKNLTIETISDGIVGILGLEAYNFNLYGDKLKGLSECYREETGNNIELLHQMGVVFGDNSNKIDLQKGYTRGEVAKLIYLMKNTDIKKDYIPEIVLKLNLVWLDDKAELQRKSCINALGNIPLFILEDLSENHWKICFTKESIWNYYTSDYYDNSVAATGLCSYDSKEIYISFCLNQEIKGTLTHEIGHFVQQYYFSNKSVLLKEYYKSEKESISEVYRKYSGSSVNEYFADGFSKTMLYRNISEESNRHPKNVIPLLYIFLTDWLNDMETYNKV